MLIGRLRTACAGIVTPRLLIIGLALVPAACSRQPAGQPVAGATATTEQSALANEAGGVDWPGYGRTYGEAHASPLTQIDASTVARLGLAWSLDLPDVHNGATIPLEVGGTLYFTVDQSKVHAVDAISGREKWSYDPDVGKIADRKLRYALGPRGIAYWNGKIYVGTTDGRLIALDARSGEPVWSMLTGGRRDGRTISGAPRVFDGMVVIGHDSSEANPARGFVTAFDAETGQVRWRVLTIPGDPAPPFESKALEKAAPSWPAPWQNPGGGAVSNAIAYDPTRDTVYIGTGGGTPRDRAARSPGGGDNLYLSSIVALDAKTGAYQWHYQETPGDDQGYGATADITLATLSIGGKAVDVLLQASANGFLYVLDRATGKPISADPFARVTWAKSIDAKTGRPVEDPHARDPGRMLLPGPGGAHGDAAQSFNTATGLLYVPARERRDGGGTGDVAPGSGSSRLLAWDPVARKAAWDVATPGYANGGTMTTLGGLVFQGQADGRLVARDASTGRALWSFACGMGISGAPISYAIDGVQYVSVVAGWGGDGAAALGSLGAQHGWVFRVHHHRLLTFRLGATGRLPDGLPGPALVRTIDDPAQRIGPARAALGGQIFAQNCAACHGAGAVAAGFAPDLRASRVPLRGDIFDQVVRGGILQERGMPQYGELTDQQLSDIRVYLRQRARVAIGVPAVRAR